MNNKSKLLSQLRIEHQDEQDPIRTWLWIILLLLVLLVISGLVKGLSSSDAIAVKTQTARVATGNSGSASVLDATGYVVARRYATVSSKVTAKVLEVFVEEGMEVKEGQVVARLDDSNTNRHLAVEEAGLALAVAELDEARARLGEAERVQDRVSEIYRRELISESEFDAATSNLQSLQAQLAAREAQVLSARRRVELQQQDMDDLVLRAPFTGVVISKDAQPGEMISPVSAGGGFTRTGICSLVDMDSLEIEVDVNESYIQRVTAEQTVKATLEAYPNWQIPARVIAIVPAADRQKATVRVRVGFETLDARILPDMGVRVAFLEGDASEDATTENRSDVTIAANALARKNGEPHVFVVNNNNVYSRPVDVERRNDHEYWVTAGLSPGESYILDPPSTLVEGSVITVK